MTKVIADIAKEIGSGLTPLRSNSSFWDSCDVPWLKTDQLGSHLIYETNEYISQSALEETSIKLWPPHTVSIAMYGEGKTRGNTSIIMSEMTTNQACCNVIVDENAADYRFLYYWLKYNYVQLRSLASGVRKNLNSDDIKGFPFPNIEMINQTRIADVLSVIDNRIDCNERTCVELESMAKTLYDYWFVQFDFPDENGKPYHTSGGKMIGNDRTKRKIPNGWKDGNLYDIADFVNGLACQKYRPEIGEEGLPVIKIKEMHDGISEDTEFVSMNIPKKYIVEDGDLLFSWSATLETMFWYGGKGGLNQHIFKVVPKASYPIEYVYEQLSAYIINFVKMAEARKTTMGHITTDHLNQSKIVLPSPDVLEKYAIKVKPIYQRIGQLKRENIVLSKLRDWLLPMLMNGQATVVDEEKKKSSISETAAIPATDPRFTKWLKTMGLAARGTVNRQTLLDIFNAIDEDDKQ